MNDGYDTSALIELHKLMDQACDGQAMALYERLEDQKYMSGHSAEVIKLPGLHERSASRTGHLLRGLRGEAEMAVVIDFPRPQWLRNADRRKL
ncbi:hypothetical protein [Rhizobium sp.]|jgi:hypothetical protein|uniref:hypothetical protein n=1 Tax=Rhizobium sp. TaxID=391 RepID=UPI000E7E5B9E|nr:hypothetical protein [Rhizobium sp.]